MSMAIAEFFCGLDEALLDDRIRQLESERQRVVAEQAMVVAVAEGRVLASVDVHHSTTAYLCVGPDLPACR